MNDLGIFLDQLLARYHRASFLGSDPLEYPRGFEDPYDQECVALISALLAYGNARQVRRSVKEVLTRIESVSKTPARFVRDLESADARSSARTLFKGFVHRFNVGSDLVLLLELLQRSWKEHGSLGAHFVSFLEPGAPDVGDALNGLIAQWRAWAGKRGKGTFAYLLNAPKDGSCCKRWCMFLKWVSREDDGLDLGLWCEKGKLAATFPSGRWVSPGQLVMPLDTHVGRISQYLGLTSRRTMNWSAALEVTRSLKLCHADDPTRYDFAISRLGILGLCRRSFRSEICVKCELVHVCKFAKGKFPLGIQERAELDSLP